MNPEQILAAVAERYAACSSYRDAGHVVNRFVRPDGGTRTSVKPFATAFVRPDRFRFEFRDRFTDAGEWHRYLVWAGGGAVRTWWDIQPGVEEPASLGSALGAATGVSGGASGTVPGLLLPSVVSGRRLTDLGEVAWLTDADLGGVACHRLGGRVAPARVDLAQDERHSEEVRRLTGRPLERAERSPLTVWIDRGTLLVRRIEESVRFETFRTECVTEYEPQAGVAVPDGELAFDPPGGVD